jgi:hypothetical protein
MHCQKSAADLSDEADTVCQAAEIDRLLKNPVFSGVESDPVNVQVAADAGLLIAGCIILRCWAVREPPKLRLERSGMISASSVRN